MITYEGIDRNFRFLVIEVRAQIEMTARLLRDPTETLVRTLLSRDNYTDTLKALIEKKCMSFFRHTPQIDRSSANLTTAINICTSNLERIADFCGNVAGQVRRVTDPAVLQQFDFQRYFKELLEVVPLIGDALINVDTKAALRVCQSEATLDRYYAEDFERIRLGLRRAEDTDGLLCALYISHYLERMGDSLLNIGEGILLAATGEKLKLHEYVRLHDTLRSQQPDTSLRDYSIDFSWETRSGCRIAKVEEKDHVGTELEAVFKKGQASKLRRERENIARWEKVMPRLTPRVLDFREEADDAALLLEFLDGFTLRDLVLNGEPSVIDAALDALERMLRNVWRETKRDQPVSAKFMQQAASRLDEVFRLHPEFVNACYEIGSLSVESLETLLEKGRQVEERYPAPFSVLVHGDLNADNIIYDHRDQSIHVIDVYRSTDSDYVQDISVLLVSNFRLPVFEGDIRDTLNHVMMRLFRFARSFAHEQHDATFGARLALGLARGLITSTRFEIDGSFASEMYARAVYLLEKVIQLQDVETRNFDLTPEVLVF